MNLVASFLPPRLSLCVLGFSMLAFAPVASAFDGGKAVTDPKNAGPEFAIQGEYVGNVLGEKWGAQIIAWSESEMELIGYKGGLPGDGWSRGDETQRGKGTLANGVLTVKKEEWMGVAEKGVLTIKSLEGAELAKLTKTERKSPTLGAKPPEGAVVLFDGSNVEQWDKGELVEGNLLGATDCSTKKNFGDHTLHIEFRTPYMLDARGQGRGNSGVYIQGRYECQVLDSFGLDGKDNECGGIYSINQPIVNMCLPPLSWQTYDMDFKAGVYDASGKRTQAPRVTIRQNGVVIHKDLELAHGTPGHNPEGPGPDHIFLQNHGNPVAFRNIWVVEKK